MKRNPFVVGLVSVGVLALLSAFVFFLGLSEAMDYAEPDRGGVVSGVVLMLVCVGVGVLALLSAAVLAGISWELRQNRRPRVGDDEARPVTSLLDTH